MALCVCHKKRFANSFYSLFGKKIEMPPEKNTFDGNVRRVTGDTYKLNSIISRHTVSNYTLMGNYMDLQYFKISFKITNSNNNLSFDVLKLIDLKLKSIILINLVKGPLYFTQMSQQPSIYGILYSKTHTFLWSYFMFKYGLSLFSSHTFLWLNKT
jgi:hypothetical protein